MRKEKHVHCRHQRWKAAAGNATPAKPMNGAGGKRAGRNIETPCEHVANVRR